MTIQDLIQRKIKLIDSDLRLSSDQLKDTRELTPYQEQQIINRRYILIKARKRLIEDLFTLTYAE